jgi:hypothetical protein
MNEGRPGGRSCALGLANLPNLASINQVGFVIGGTIFGPPGMAARQAILKSGHRMNSEAADLVDFLTLREASCVSFSVRNLISSSRYC